ncbi:MAG TPA: hypothetical protein VF552_11390, partial [Allosphingosinicella sp.]
MMNEMPAPARLSGANADTLQAGAVAPRYARLGVPAGTDAAGDGAGTAALSGGGFVLVWVVGSSVQARLFDSDGLPAGAAFAVAAGAAASEPSVVGLSGGGFAVAWTAAGSADRDVLVQAFDAAGAKVGAEQQVAADAAGDQQHSRLAALDDGGYAVAWDDAAAAAVRVQLFAADGSKSGAERTVAAADAAGAPALTDVASLSGGRLLVTFEAASATGTILKGQLLTAEGAAAGASFALDPQQGIESDAAIAPLAGGGFLLVWTRAAGDPSGSGVFAARYDADGRALGFPFPVNSTAAGEQGRASVRMLADGGFVVAWTSAATGAASGELRAQLFDASGAKCGAEFLVASGALPLAGSVSVLSDGAFVVGYDAGAPTVQLFTPTSDANLVLSLSKTALSETSIANVAFATLAIAEGAAVGSTYSYAIVADSSGGAFQLDGNRLYVVDSTKLDHETRPNLTLTVRVTDELGNSVDRIVDLQVTDTAGAEARYSAGAQFGLSAATGTQAGSSQTALAGGGFVAVWSGQDGNLFGARAQLFDAAGNKQGAEIAVNAAPAGSQIEPRVAALGTGFVVTWSDSVGDDAGGGIKAQIFDAGGARIGAEFVVNSTTAATQNAPDIDRLAGGGFVVAWADASAASADANLRAIRAQRFDDAGNKVGGELLVNGTTAGDQFGASVTGLSGGGFVVSWTDRDSGAEASNATAVHAQIFDAAGARIGGEILVPTHNAGVQAVSSVVALASGNFVVAWHSNDGGSDFSVKAQMFDAFGARIGAEFRVETNVAGDQLYVVATALADGGFTVSWEDHGTSSAAGKRTVVAQMFDAAGGPVGDEFVVNAITSGTAFRTSGLTALANGDLVASWTEGSRVYGRVFTAGGAPAPASADAFATDETRSLWGRLAHAGEGQVTEVNGISASVGERILLASGAALVLREDGSFAYDPNGAFGHLVATAPTGYHHMAFATSATDSFTYTIGGVVHEAVVTVAGVKSATDTYYGNGTGQGVGHDFLPGTTGAERLIGGLGNDSYTVNHVGDVVVELPGEGIDSVSTTLLYYKVPDAVENLTFTGTGNATLIGNALDNRLTGGAGSDLMHGGGGGNDVFALYGGSDTAIGGAGDDVFNLETGYHGNAPEVQTLVGGGGTDLLTIQADSGFPTGILLTDGGPQTTGWATANGSFFTFSDRIEGSGISSIQIKTGRGDTYAKYVLFLHDSFAVAGTTLTIEARGLYDGESLTILKSGNSETDAHLHVTGGSGADDITGGAIADVLRGGDGNDRLDGGLGNDTIDGGSGDDNIHAVATSADGGTKTVEGGSGSDRLHVSFGPG